MTATKLPPLTRLRCDRCGARLREGRYVRSTFTKSRYCGDIDACAKRAKKRKRRDD